MKVFFATCVILAAIITFETAFNGLERAFHTLITAIDRPKKDLVTVDEKLTQIADTTERLSTLTIETIESEYNDRYRAESDKLAEQKAPIQERINELRASVRTEVIESVERSLEAAQAERARLITARENELASKTAEFQNRAEELRADITEQRRSLQNQLKPNQKT